MLGYVLPPSVLSGRVSRSSSENRGPGKLTYVLPVMFSFPLCYVHVLPAGGGGGTGKRKSADVERK